MTIANEHLLAPLRTEGEAILLWGTHGAGSHYLGQNILTGLVGDCWVTPIRLLAIPLCRVVWLEGRQKPMTCVSSVSHAKQSLFAFLL